MTLGYSAPLYLLPFDHRDSYMSGMFHLKPPLSADQHEAVADSKRVIYEGFKQALADGVKKAYAGILVDEEFGAPILADAHQNGYITAVSTEKSGSAEFEFQYGNEFGRHLETVDPTFAKVLVRYNPEGDAELNQRQTARLKTLSDYCAANQRHFMFELLVPATDTQLASVHGDKDAYDLHLRPGLMLSAIRTLQDAGVEPSVWKVEGLDRREDCVSMVEVARRDGRDEVGCIVLGRGADEKKVISWLDTAASVPGFIGFAVGRTSFWDPLVDFEARKSTRAATVAAISARYREWVGIFERARLAR